MAVPELYGLELGLENQEECTNVLTYTTCVNTYVFNLCALWLHVCTSACHIHVNMHTSTQIYLIPTTYDTIHVLHM